MGDMPSPSEYIRFYNSSVSQGDIQIDHVQVSTPVYDAWPPPSYTNILFERDDRDDEISYVRKVVSAFMNKAWRREVTKEEVGLKMDFFKYLLFVKAVSILS